MKASLDDIALFLDVASHGGLAGAAQVSGTSQATVSRRMTRLERDLGKRLFLRGRHGYALSAEGRALLPLARALRQSGQQVEDWTLAEARPAPVRISGGTWTSLWMATRIGQVWRPDLNWAPVFVPSEARLDIARREVDIGIRNDKPTQPWLAAQPLRHIHYAAFARDAACGGWITSGNIAHPTPSARWIRAQDGPAALHADDPRLAAQLAQQGLGRVVLPTFAAGLIPGLQQVSDPIADLSHREWLVSHHDGRHDPPTRTALRAIATLARGA
ncbi:hypothetical protein ACMU_06105 [Actibacterium mucosum KCTC 23349]|uniref:HTH lysR-type domain-containing protein n=1 Tax=Actibacterium mucosum KCTC 23349 TaxID=1454373 RepID=A0A037ZK86_9RHOB|nr:LysR family transcriptional regulator [Actibacterium mucosum]KAJ56513.1 hypothetical protein ACMU_06105 [Actibacterium mucosum KCTC 23349]